MRAGSRESSAVMWCEIETFGVLRVYCTVCTVQIYRNIIAVLFRYSFSTHYRVTTKSNYERHVSTIHCINRVINDSCISHFIKRKYVELWTIMFTNYFCVLV